MAYIHALETRLGRKAQMDLLPMQAGDIEETAADVSALQPDFNYKPQTTVTEASPVSLSGISNIINSPHRHVRYKPGERLAPGNSCESQRHGRDQPSPPMRLPVP